MLTRNIWGRELLYRETPDETYYYLPDAHGDIIGLTDGMGNITKSYAYDPFGNQETSALPGFGLNSTITLWQNEVEKADNPFGYCGEYLDEESGLIYLRGRYYDPGLARFTQEDPTQNGFNWYAYCGNNPINYADPSGYVEVGLRSYADTYEGSTVAWNNETKTATVTYNGITLSVKSTAQNNIDGHIYVDDSLFVNSFGEGNEELVVYQDSVTNNVSIRANFNITGKGANKMIDDTTEETYTGAFLQGIKDNWSGTFGEYNVSTYTGLNANGVTVKIKDEAGVSHVRYIVWSIANPGTMTIYTKFSNGSIRTADEFGYTASHEFGHILGIGDAYLNKFNPNAAAANDMMRWNNGVVPVVSELDITMVLNAYTKNKHQDFVKIP